MVEKPCKQGNGMLRANNKSVYQTNKHTNQGIENAKKDMTERIRSKEREVKSNMLYENRSLNVQASKGYLASGRMVYRFIPR